MCIEKRKKKKRELYFSSVFLISCVKQKTVVSLNCYCSQGLLSPCHCQPKCLLCLFFFLMTIVFGNTGYVEHFFLFCGNFMIHIEQFNNKILNHHSCHIVTRIIKKYIKQRILTFSSVIVHFSSILLIVAWCLEIITDNKHTCMFLPRPIFICRRKKDKHQDDLQTCNHTNF